MNVWVVLNFAILVALLVYALRKPLGQMFMEKHVSIKKAVDEAEELRLTVERMVLEYQDKLKNLDVEVQALMNEARAAGEREKQMILQRARRSAEKIKADARLSIEKERARMTRELEKETLAGAIAKARMLLKKQVSAKEHSAFTNELISQLEDTRGQGS